MNIHSRRPLSLTNLRAFEAVARLLSFGAAADELYLTPSAISRQIKSLEDELGATLFVRGTRSVQMSPDGQTLLRAVEPWLAKLDGSVQQIRRSRSRRRVSVATFASFGSLWLLPRIEAAFRKALEFDPHSHDGHEGLGIALARLGRIEEALHHLNEALRLNPYLRRAREELARLSPDAQTPT